MVTNRMSRFLFLLPALFVLSVVAAWPLAKTFLFSLTDATLGDIEAKNWIGFDHYKTLLMDPLWWQSVKNTLFFAVISVTLETCLGLAIALLLHQNIKGRGLLRASILIPWAIPTIVSAKMWGWMLHDMYGVINFLLLKIGIIAEPIAWTAHPNLALISVIFVDVWKTTPFMALLILAGLQFLPLECYEAAKVDGVSPWRVFWRVTFPLLKPVLIVAVIFRSLDALRVFDLIYVLTSNSQDTMSMSGYVRQHLVDFQDLGYGSAASMMLFLIIGLLTVVYMKMTRLQLDKERAV